MAETSGSLAGKTLFVSGASRGIGLAIALRAAKDGANVAIAAKTDKPHPKLPGTIHTAAEEIEAAGGSGTALLLDLSDPAAGAARLGEAGHLDILVNNAGIIRRAESQDFSEADWDDVMDVNLKAVFLMCQAFGKAAIARGTGGRIVNIASLLSFQGGIRVPSYTASKHGVAGLTKILANEWAKHGINVNAIAPGYFATNNTAALQADETRNTEILGRIPAGRWGKPSDLGGAAVFLSSSASDYVQGITLPVDGGWLAR